MFFIGREAGAHNETHHKMLNDEFGKYVLEYIIRVIDLFDKIVLYTNDFLKVQHLQEEQKI